MLRAYKTKLILNNKEKSYMRQCAGVSRFAFNWALAAAKIHYEETGEHVSARYVLRKQFNSIKKEQFPWICNYPQTIVEYAFDDVDSAYKHFFRRLKQGEKPGFPRFKSKHGRKSFQLRKSIHIIDGKIKLPRIGWLRLAEKDYIPEEGRIMYATISEKAHEWYISVSMETETPEPVPLNPTVLGIDRGVKSLVVCSNGYTGENPRALQKHEKRLKNLQRKLSRQKQRSNNWRKTKDKIKRLHNKIANIRRHQLHNISRHVTNSVRPQKIVLETLNVKGMMSKAKPKQDENGRYLHNNRAQKAGLNRAIADASMGELGRQIKYKSEWLGIEIDHQSQWFPSSKMCSRCHAIDSDLKLSDRTYNCSHCGLVIDRDLNASLNLKRQGEQEKQNL